MENQPLDDGLGTRHLAALVETAKSDIHAA